MRVARKREAGPARVSLTLTLRFTDTCGLDSIAPKTAEQLLSSILVAAESIGRAKGLAAAWSTARADFKERK